jgi:nucleoid DNA-binding protein
LDESILLHIFSFAYGKFQIALRPGRQSTDPKPEKQSEICRGSARSTTKGDPKQAQFENVQYMLPDIFSFAYGKFQIALRSRRQSTDPKPEKQSEICRGSARSTTKGDPKQAQFENVL